MKDMKSTKGKRTGSPRWKRLAAFLFLHVLYTLHYEKLRAELELMSALAEGEASARNKLQPNEV